MLQVNKLVVVATPSAGGTFDRKYMLQMALTLVSTITSAALSWKEFFRDETRLKVPHNKLEWFLKFS